MKLNEMLSLGHIETKRRIISIAFLGKTGNGFIKSGNPFVVLLL